MLDRRVSKELERLVDEIRLTRPDQRNALIEKIKAELDKHKVA